MVKAASLVYAIFISLIIAILCYGLLLMYTLHLDLNDHFDLRERLLLHNQSALAFLAANYLQIDPSSPTYIFPEETDIATHFNSSTWGVFQKWEVISVAKQDSVRQDFITAGNRDKKSPALFLRNNDEAFKIAGKSLIEGDIFISPMGLKKTTITGNSGFYEPVHKGSVFASENQLPIIAPFLLEYPADYEVTLLEDIRETTFIQPFHKVTKVIEAGSRLENINLKGNIIVYSKDTLHIFKSSFLEDIILDAPKVIFHSGFSGNVQVFASKEIILESEVKLNYPSALIIASESEEEARIICGENSEVKGVIILKGKGLLTENKKSIVIEENATITGDIFCDGNLSLYGTVKGSIYTSSFLHKTASTQYDNLIFNAKILAGDVPDVYFQLFTAGKKTIEEPVLIKKL